MANGRRQEGIGDQYRCGSYDEAEKQVVTQIQEKTNKTTSSAQIAGVDVGGTFTDFVLVGAEGRISVRKRLSSPQDPSESVLHGLQAARKEGLLASGFVLIHGTTVATNALLERRGAKTAFLTTAGFKDLLHIGRQARLNLYSFHPVKAVPLLPRGHCFEITERSDWQGETLIPLDAAQVDALLDHLQAEAFESVAVCFLFAHLNNTQERTVGEKARSRGFTVSLSCDIAPEPREFERASTTVANAFVAPVMAHYLSRLEMGLPTVGAASLRIMQSSGGALSAGEAAAQAVKTALSGPAGGVVAAARVGTLAGFPDLMTFDMGGTSTDVALLQNGECPIVTTASLGGMPLRTPMLDIHTVGAGGGSLARRDAAGGLRVGPQSAGADPGPVAYGKGEQLTVTDANVLLGRLPADTRLAGSLPLDLARVKNYAEVFAAELGISTQEGALGILRVANAAMTRALRHISVERGHDPADFTLLSFGGAGGLHACALAESLNMTTVLIPRFPGAFSALGLALADVRRDFVHSLPITGAPDWHAHATAQSFEEHFVRLAEQATQDMEREGFARGTWQAQRWLDLRYVGQAFDLRIPYQSAGLPATIEAFHAAHRQRYGHADPQEPVEAIAVRLTAVASGRTFDLHAGMPDTPSTLVQHTEVVFETGTCSTEVYLREDLAAGQEINGPALVLQSDATTLLSPDWRGVTDSFGNLILTHKEVQ